MYGKYCTGAIWGYRTFIQTISAYHKSIHLMQHFTLLWMLSGSSLLVVVMQKHNECCFFKHYSCDDVILTLKSISILALEYFRRYWPPNQAAHWLLHQLQRSLVSGSELIWCFQGKVPPCTIITKVIAFSRKPSKHSWAFKWLFIQNNAFSTGSLKRMPLFY